MPYFADLTKLAVLIFSIGLLRQNRRADHTRGQCKNYLCVYWIMYLLRFAIQLRYYLKLHAHDSI